MKQSLLSPAIWLLQLFCAVAAQAQYTFQKEVTGTNGMFCIDRADDNTYWTGTFLGKIIQFDDQGSVLRAFVLKQSDSMDTEIVYDIEHAQGGGFLALYDRSNNNTALDDNLILGRFNATGQPVWQTAVYYGEVKHWAHNRFALDADGNAFITSLRGSPTGTGPNFIQIIKTSANGQFLWANEYKSGGPAYPRFIQRLPDNTMLVGGNVNFNNQQNGFLLQIGQDGQVLWSGRYNTILFKALAIASDGDRVVAFTEQGALPQKTGIARLAPDGQIRWARRINIPNALTWAPDLKIHPNGQILLFNYEGSTEAPAPDLMAFSPDGQLAWARRYDACKNYGITQAAIASDGGIMAVRYRSKGHLLLKTDATGLCLDCQPESVSVFLTDITDNMTQMIWDIIPKNKPNPSSTDFTPVEVTTQSFCERQRPVYELILDKDTVCTRQQVDATVVSDVQADQYRWTFTGGSPATFSQVAPPPVLYAAAGLNDIRLTVQFGFCRDTLSQPIVVLASPQPLPWPTDSLVCRTLNPFVLSAQTSNGLDYQWSDGTIGTQKVITESGKYGITVSNGLCQISDTIQINLVERLPLDLPSDTLFCGGDTLWLDAGTSGADRYEWNDGTTTARKPVIRSGYYSVSVFRGGCQSADFISVNLLPPPPPLPADTFFCKGSSLELSVGNAISGEISWNGQPGSSTYQVESAGWVHRRIAYEHCLFSDSVQVYEYDCRTGFAYYAPNIFRPESGGPNDLFQIWGDGLIVNHLSVFDRWGNLVFDGADTDTIIWDGRSARNGKVVQPGIYIWQARVAQGEKEGWIGGDVFVSGN